MQATHFVFDNINPPGMLGLSNRQAAALIEQIGARVEQRNPDKTAVQTAWLTVRLLQRFKAYRALRVGRFQMAGA